MPKKNLLVAGVLLVVVCVGGFLYHQHLVSSPEYVISHIIAAYEKKNEAEFEQYFDIDSFSRRLWMDYKDWRDKDSGSIWPPIRENIDSTDALKMTMRNVVGGKKALPDLDRIDESSSTTVSIAQLLDRLHDYKINSITDNGDSKKIRLVAKTWDEEELAFDLLLKNIGGDWKIYELDNVGEVCTAFKTFSKESVISYLKTAQPIQDKYQEMLFEALEMPGGHPSDHMIYRPDMENEYTASVKYLLARKATEDYRAQELSGLEVNPFGGIVNSNRINASKCDAQYYDYLVQYVKQGMEKKSFDGQGFKELYKKADEAHDDFKKYDKRVVSVIELVGYEPAKNMDSTTTANDDL